MSNVTCIHQDNHDTSVQQLITSAVPCPITRDPMICSLSVSVPFSSVISLAVSDIVSEATSFTTLSRDLLWDEYGVARGGFGIFTMAQKQHARNQAQLIIFISILTNEPSVDFRKAPNSFRSDKFAFSVARRTENNQI